MTKKLDNKLKEIREKRGLTQKELADLVEASKPHIAKLEDSDRRLSDVWIEKFCNVLNCTPNDLFGITDLTVASDNPNPISIDEEVYTLAKEVTLETMQDQGITFSEDELLDQVMRAYKIGLELKAENSGDVKPSKLAVRWIKGLQ